MLRKILLLGVSIFSFSVILPSVAICVPFSVNGDVYIEGECYELSGTMDISEPYVSDLGNISFTYDITNFNLLIGNQSYTGTSNSSEIISINYAVHDDPFTTEFDSFHLTSDDESMDWYILSENVVFYDENGVAYQDIGAPTDFYSLPYMIAANNISGESYGDGYDSIYLETLTFERLAPIPEPETFLLLLLGLFGISIINRKKSLIIKL